MPNPTINQIKKEDKELYNILNKKNMTEEQTKVFNAVYNCYKRNTNKKLSEIITTKSEEEAKEEIRKIIYKDKKIQYNTKFSYARTIGGIVYYYHQMNKTINIYKRQDTKNDITFQRFIETRQISPNTTKSYITALTSFTNHIQQPIKEYIEKQKLEQRSRIENNIIIEYNPNESTLNDDIYTWKQKLKQNNKTPSTIEQYTTKLLAFLKANNLKLPKNNPPILKKTKWDKITQEDIKTIIENTNLFEKALITFIASTGIRSVDVRHFTIGDFMKATQEYHNTEIVNDFLIEAPQDMLGYWEFIPIKTQKHGIECKVFNSPESSNYILKYLSIRQSKILQQNPETSIEEALHKTDYLFTPKNKPHNQISRSYFSHIFDSNNELLRDIKMGELMRQYHNGEINAEVYDEKVNDLPTFRAHGLRKYAVSVFANHNVNLRVCALFEGHKPPMTNDLSYIQLNKDILETSYRECLLDLMFMDTTVNRLTTVEKYKFEQKLEELEELKKHMNEILTNDDLVNYKIF